MSHYYYAPCACPQTQNSHSPGITSPRNDFTINVPILQNNLYSHLVTDSYLHPETFKKSFPDGITGNRYFFSEALMHNILCLMENIYCTELEVSSEQRKTGLCP